jgi:hypothetical protein
MISPIAISLPTNCPAFAVGDYVTVELYGGKVACAKVTRRQRGESWIRIVGLNVPQPYMVGDELVIADDKVIDCGW